MYSNVIDLKGGRFQEVCPRAPITLATPLAERLDSLVALPEKIVEAEERAVSALEHAKKAVIDSVSRAYKRSRRSLRDCHDSVRPKAQTLSKDARAIKARVQSANERWDIALKADDVLGLFTQLTLLKSSVQELQDKVIQAIDPIDASTLVHGGVSLPDDLDQITSGWLGLAQVLNGKLITSSYCCRLLLV